MNIVAPIIGISRHRLLTDGDGVTTLVAFHGCPLHCKYCLNPQCNAPIGQLTLLGIKYIDRFEYTKDVKSIYKTDVRFSKDRLRVGKFKCEVLKSIRVHAAECNNIVYTPHNCEHTVCTTGCCPMCDKELACVTKEYYRINNGD